MCFIPQATNWVSRMKHNAYVRLFTGLATAAKAALTSNTTEYTTIATDIDIDSWYIHTDSVVSVAAAPIAAVIIAAVIVIVVVVIVVCGRGGGVGSW